MRACVRARAPPSPSRTPPLRARPQRFSSPPGVASGGGHHLTSERTPTEGNPGVGCVRPLRSAPSSGSQAVELRGRAIALLMGRISPWVGFLGLAAPCRPSGLSPPRAAGCPAPLSVCVSTANACKFRRDVRRGGTCRERARFGSVVTPGRSPTCSDNPCGTSGWRGPGCSPPEAGAQCWAE